MELYKVNAMLQESGHRHDREAKESTQAINQPK
jgi:hypothetical protein